MLMRCFLRSCSQFFTLHRMYSTVHTVPSLHLFHWIVDMQIFFLVYRSASDLNSSITNRQDVLGLCTSLAGWLTLNGRTRLLVAVVKAIVFVMLHFQVSPLGLSQITTTQPNLPVELNQSLLNYSFLWNQLPGLHQPCTNQSPSLSPHFTSTSSSPSSLPLSPAATLVALSAACWNIFSTNLCHQRLLIPHQSDSLQAQGLCDCFIRNISNSECWINK